MKRRWTKVFWLVVVCLMAAAYLGPCFARHSGGPALVAKTRDALRAQGFKTDFSQFDFSTPPEIRARMAILTAPASNQSSRLPVQWPGLAETTPSGAVVVVAKQDALHWPEVARGQAGGLISWDQFRQLFDEYQDALDASCQAALSGKIRFNIETQNGHNILLPHLAPLKTLTHAFAARAILNLHDGQQNSAWTNLLAATRLVTAWETEPSEISYFTRFLMAKTIFDTTWQSLQAANWPENRLAQLQTEWERADFFTNLPDTADFTLACDADDYSIDARYGSAPFPIFAPARPTFMGYLQAALYMPFQIWPAMLHRWQQARYDSIGRYEEQRDLLLYDRDRAIELRDAAHAPTWAQMATLPGVTNHLPFPTRHFSLAQSRRMNRNMVRLMEGAGGGLLGHAAEAEAQRRILITALALERYHAQHGAYPPQLAALAPELLTAAPLDFMDGRPLRYQLNGDGHYRLYSVGLDCVDDGGKMMNDPRPAVGPLAAVLPMGDIVWPFPASVNQVEAARRQQSDAVQDKADAAALAQAEAQWEHAADHQADVAKLLAAPMPNPPDLHYGGQPVSFLLRISSSSQPTLRDLLTLKQIFTGDEPERVTFELPLSYDALPRVGEIYLLIDTNNDDSDEGSVVQQMDLRRAPNGSCLLLWAAIFESPGPHVLHAALQLHGDSPDSTADGPVLPFFVSNLCQFSAASAHYDPQTGVLLQLKFPETNAEFVLQCQTTNGAVLKTIAGAAANGIASIHWDLLDEQGRKFTGSSFDCVWNIKLPASGRTQILKGP